MSGPAVTSKAGTASIAVLAAALLAPASPAFAQAECAELLGRSDVDLDTVVDAGCELTAEQISRLMDNPVGELVMMPIQYDRLTVEEAFTGSEQVIETVKIIPTYPVRVGDWNLVNRAAFSFARLPIDTDAFADVGTQSDTLDVSIDGPPLVSDPFAGSTSGFGDLAYVGLFTPRESTPIGDGQFIWAAGPTMILPTASEDFLGQGKVQVGPAFAAAYLGRDWTVGVFPQHWWSVSGDDDRPTVSQTNIQYFVYRKLPNQWSIGASPNISIDWTDDDGAAVNFPIGIGLNKTLFLGRVPARVGVEASYYALRDDDAIAPEWGLRFSITPVVPAAFLR
ncbi:MAG: hypothetical protein PVI23_13695 [Maricaulaceae bacterium]|jgi:hypothetical protein